MTQEVQAKQAVISQQSLAAATQKDRKFKIRVKGATGAYGVNRFRFDNDGVAEGVSPEHLEEFKQQFPDVQVEILSK